MFKWLRWTLLCFIVVLLFWKPLNHPFFQDDFFALATTKLKFIPDIVGLFKLPQEAVYYRPLGIQIYFALMQSLGFRQPIFFHIASLLIHFINIFLVYKLTDYLWKKDAVSFLTAFFYAVSPLHYFWLGWAVNFSFGLWITWILLAVLAIIKRKFIYVFMFLVLSLLTNELALTAPFLLILISIKIYGRAFFRNKKNIFWLSIYFILIGSYFLWRLQVGLKTEGDYRVSFKLPIQSLRWYFLWMLGVSDIVRDQMINLWKFNTRFLTGFPEVVAAYYLQLVAAGSLIGVTFYKVANKDYQMLQNWYFCLLWALISLSPILFFPAHLYSHYAALAAIGLYWLVAQVIFFWHDRGWYWLSWAGIGIWLIVVTINIRLNCLTSWMADHAWHSLVAQKLLQKNSEKLLPDKKVFIVNEGYGKMKLVLADGNALSFLYDINPQNVVYLKEVNDIPEVAALNKEKNMLTEVDLSKIESDNNFAIIR